VENLAVCWPLPTCASPWKHGPEHRNQHAPQRTFEPTKAMMEWMTDKLQAKFPWPKYFQYVMKVGCPYCASLRLLALRPHYIPGLSRTLPRPSESAARWRTSRSCRGTTRACR
jgi:hypothetical protein